MVQEGLGNTNNEQKSNDDERSSPNFYFGARVTLPLKEDVVQMTGKAKILEGSSNDHQQRAIQSVSSDLSAKSKNKDLGNEKHHSVAGNINNDCNTQQTNQEDQGKSPISEEYKVIDLTSSNDCNAQLQLYAIEKPLSKLTHVVQHDNSNNRDEALNANPTHVDQNNKATHQDKEKEKKSPMILLVPPKRSVPLPP